ncbi:unnamed protein product [Aphanomyces euteiches]|nr:hypothetical protein AeRB84_001380 [Aphanomyces euteiches]
MTEPSIQVLLEPHLLPLISDFQPGVCPDMVMFSKWTTPLLRSHPACPPGKTYFELIQHGMDEWYTSHGGVDSLDRLIASLPKMEKISLVDAVFSGRLKVLEWFHKTGRLAGIDFPLLSIAAWNGQLDIIRYLDNVNYPGCAGHAIKWATSKRHNDVVHYLHQNPRPPASCGCGRSE